MKESYLVQYLKIVQGRLKSDTYMTDFARKTLRSRFKELEPDKEIIEMVSPELYEEYIELEQLFLSDKKIKNVQ